MIGSLPDEILLKIFRYYLHKSPRFWPTLVHICRTWRRIVFASQHTLRLRLFCAPGTPVLKTLDCWPALPIAIEYGGSLALDLPAPEDEVNIIAALKQSSRVSSIRLTTTTTLLDKLYAIRPFLELEDLILLSQDNVPPILPSTFLWGARLRRLHLTRICIPGLLQLLYSSRNLEDIQLHEALDPLNTSNPWYFSFEELTDALSWLAKLQSLSLRFSSTTYRVRPPSPPERRIVLPALTRFIFRGPAKYLERIISRINTPRLGDIQVTVSDKFVYDLSSLGEFVNRIEIHKSYHQARILSSERAISISLTPPEASICFKLQLLSELLSVQLYAISYILPHFSALLLNVEDLCISTTRSSSVEATRCRGRWLELLDLFTNVKWLHLGGNDSTNFVRALQLEGVHWQPKNTLLPTLYKLYLPQTGPHHAPLSEVVVSFMTSRWRSGYHIGVEYEHLCRISEPHGRGTSRITIHGASRPVLTFLKLYLFLSQSRLITRCSPMTSF